MSLVGEEAACVFLAGHASRCYLWVDRSHIFFPNSPKPMGSSRESENISECRKSAKEPDQQLSW
jgi:hypothetical protein